MDTPNVLAVGKDLGRAVRERPALVIGGAVLGLLGLTVLSRQGGAESEEGAGVDPAAGLFPGVDPFGGGIPGSGSVPFGGYPSAGGGDSAPAWTPPEWVPGLGLSCNGEARPAIAGLPGSWDCTDDGWVYRPPVAGGGNPPPVIVPPTPAPKPAPKPGGTPPPATIHYRATVTRATALWNPSTKRWVYNGPNAIRPGTALVVRSARYTMGGQSTYPVTSPYGGYYVPASNVRLGARI